MVVVLAGDMSLIPAIFCVNLFRLCNLVRLLYFPFLQRSNIFLLMCMYLLTINVTS